MKDSIFDAPEPNQEVLYVPIITLIYTSGCHRYQKMGQPDGTNNVGISRPHILHAYQKKNFEPFLEDMTEDYVEEDNIKVL